MDAVNELPYTKQGSLEVTLDLYSEVLGLNLSWDMAIITDVFCGFPQPFQANSMLVPQLDHDYCLPTPSQFISHPII
jgi:hypothetical protein